MIVDRRSVLLVFSAAAACARNGSRAAGAVDPRTGTITLAMASDPPQLNSALTTDSASGAVLGHVLEGLLRYDAQNKLASGVAEKWKIDETTATFDLRKEARWNDGSPVTAHDFIFAWRTVLDPGIPAPYAPILHCIRNARRVHAGEAPIEELAVWADGDHRLMVELERPTPYFAQLTAFPTFLPIKESYYRASGGRYGDDAATLLFNGPFVIAQWEHNALLRLQRNPQYHGRQAIRLQAVNYDFVTADPSVVLNLFEAGEIAVAGLNAMTLRRAEKEGWPIRTAIDGALFFIEFNHRADRPTRSRRLRAAIQLVTDADEVVNRVLRLPSNRPGRSLFPSWLMGAQDRLWKEYPPPARRVDFEEARAHLAAAREELGLDAIPRLELLVDESPDSTRLAAYLQNVFGSQLSLEVRITQLLFRQRLARMAAGDFDLVVAGWGPDYNDPLTYGDLFGTANGNNHGRYTNTELDESIRVAETSLDPAERMAAFGEIQRIIHDEAVIVPLYERGHLYVQDPQLRGVVRRVFGANPDYSRGWIEVPAGVAGSRP